MAKTYGIDFPLIEDKDLALAKQWAGISTDGYAVPSMYILRADGSVYLQRHGDAKDDRIYANELLGHLDAMLGLDSSSMQKARGFSHPTRISASLGLGVHTVDDTRFATDLSIRALRTFGGHFAIGAEAGGLVLPEREARGALLVQGQLPILADVGELYLQIPVGWAKRFSDDEFGDAGFYSAVRFGLSFDASPTFQLHTELALEGTALSGASETIATRGLWRTGAAWRF